MNIDALTIYYEQAKEKFYSLHNNREVDFIGIRQNTTNKIYFLIECKDKVNSNKYKVIIPIKKYIL